MRRVIAESIAVGMKSRNSRCKLRAATMMPPANSEIRTSTSEVSVRKVVASKTLLFPLKARDLCRWTTLPVARLRLVSAGHRALLTPLGWRGKLCSFLLSPLLLRWLSLPWFPISGLSIFPVTSMNRKRSSSRDTEMPAQRRQHFSTRRVTPPQPVYALM